MKALKGVSLRIAPGRIHGLVGENGAGKTTLARIIAGLEEPDDGLISEPGVVALVPQHPRLARGLSLWENLIVGEEPGRGLFLNRRRSLEKLGVAGTRFGVEIDLEESAEGMTAGEMRTAILLGALVKRPDVLILDEPSIGLDENDRETIRRIIRKTAEEGTAVLLVSHDLYEINSLADELTVLRKGAVERTFSGSFSPEEVTSVLFPKPETEPPRSISREEPDPSGNPRLLMHNLAALHPGTGRKIGPLDLTLPPGGIIALVGLREAGIDTLERLFTGDLWITDGTMSVDGLHLPSRITPNLLRKRGLSYIPSDRIHSGTTLEGSVEENLILHQRRELHRGGFIRPQKSAAFADLLLGRFHVEGTRWNRLASLSGGNIQRVILSRELSQNPGVVVVAEPGAGLDMAGQHRLREEFGALTKKGSSILVVTSDLREAVTYADSVLVMYGGKVVGPFSYSQTERIARAMMGIEEP